MLVDVLSTSLVTFIRPDSCTEITYVLVAFVVI